MGLKLQHITQTVTYRGPLVSSDRKVGRAHLENAKHCWTSGICLSRMTLINSEIEIFPTAYAVARTG